MDRDQDLVYLRGFELSISTLKPKLAAGQRRKWRLVFEWVCTVASVSVRIRKRANCAKNNRPKSGWLFLVNTRPFPEHSSSIATFSAGRAWLEARCMTSLHKWSISPHQHLCHERTSFFKALVAYASLHQYNRPSQLMHSEAFTCSAPGHGSDWEKATVPA